MNRVDGGRQWRHMHTAPHGDSHRDHDSAPERTLSVRPSPAKGRRTSAIEGYWQEWTPPDPVLDVGYDAELHLPPGKYILNASASILLYNEAVASTLVECSLFVGETNVSLNQFTLSAGEGESISATSHIDSTAPTVVQWVCGAYPPEAADTPDAHASATAPFRLSLAVTALKVDKLHYVG